MASAFDHEAYAAQYGPALGQIAGFDAVSAAGGVDATDPDTGGSTLGYDPDQEQNIARANATSGAAPIPSPIQQQRQMSRISPPTPPKQGSGGAGPTSPSSSAAFYDPNGPQQSAAVHHAVSQLSDEQAKALANDIDGKVGAGQDSHGVPDLNTLWKHTYEAEIEAGSKKLKLDGDAADAAMNPTWRDKLAMMMDAANRASIVSSQNPALSKGQAWALATRGALDGWMQRAQGMHAAYSQEQTAFLEQAHKDADEAVKRASDQFGLQQKADNLILNQRKQTETERKNKEDERIREIEANAKKSEAGSRATGEKKGDLITGEDGYLYRVPPGGGQATQVKDENGKPVKGTKTGTDKSKSEDTTARKNADAALDKIVASIDKDESAKAKDPMNIGTYKPMETEEKRARAMEILRTQDPAAYKILQGDSADPGAAAPATKPKGGTPSWYKKPQT